MDHSHHHQMTSSAAPDMFEEAMCSMNMLFTWNTKNLCIIFRQWRVTGPISLFFSLAGVALLTAGYELVREMTRRYEIYAAKELASLSRKDNKEVLKKHQIVKAALYAVQVFYSFFIMLLFMTYNGWIMLAVALGAFLGYLVWGNTTATKTVACH